MAHTGSRSERHDHPQKLRAYLGGMQGERVVGPDSELWQVVANQHRTYNEAWTERSETGEVEASQILAALKRADKCGGPTSQDFRNLAGAFLIALITQEAREATALSFPDMPSTEMMPDKQESQEPVQYSYARSA